MAKVTRVMVIAENMSPRTPIHGVYHGGAYIDLHFGDDRAFDVINVWDYSADKPTIENTADAVRQQIREWISDAGDSLAYNLSNARENLR
jgi:hypothetical protein